MANPQKFTNDQEVLLSVGPFGGLDVTTSPLYVAPTNATATSNVAVNRNYGSYVTAQGRVPNIVGTALTNRVIGLSIADPVLAGAVSAGPIYYYPTYFILDSSRVAYMAGLGEAAVAVPGWIPPGAFSSLGYNGLTNRVVFAGGFGFFDYPNNTNAIVGFNATSFTSAIQWGITAPSMAVSVAAGAAGNLTGVYYYAATFVNATQNTESSPTPFSVALTLAAQQANLSSIPTSSDAQVTARNIYRFGGTIGGTPLLVGTISDNTTTTYVDNLADGAVTGQQLILRQDPSPGFKAIEYHKGRMWGLGSNTSLGHLSDFYSDLWFSNYGLLTSFNSVTQVLNCGYDVGDIGVGLISLESSLLILKYNSVWACYGDTPNDFVTRKLFTVGCVARGSIASAYGKTFWLGADGVYFYDGADYPTNISDGSVQQGSIRTAIDSLLRSQPFGDVCVASVLTNRTYYISFYSILGTTPSVTYGYDLISGAWTQYTFATNVFASTTLSYLGPNSTANVVTQGVTQVIGANGVVPGQVDQWFAAETDLGLPIASSWTTGVTDSGAPGVTKEYRYIEITAPTQVGAIINIEFIVNPGVNQIAKTYSVNLGGNPNQGQSNVTQVSLPPALKGYECQLVISASTSAKTIVDRVSVFGYPARQFAPK